MKKKNFNQRVIFSIILLKDEKGKERRGFICSS